MNKSQDTQANTQLIKSIFVGMAVEANIATTQRINPAKIYKDINNSAVENTRFITKALQSEREEGIKEGEAKGKLNKISYAQLRFLIDAYNTKYKEKIDTNNIMEWLTRGKEKGNEEKRDSEKKENEYVLCPYCGETLEDKMKFKNHLQYECREYINQAETLD